MKARSLPRKRKDRKRGGIMQEYVITREDLRRWCSIPLEKLEQQPNQKMKLILRERERDVAAEVGNLLAEEAVSYTHLFQRRGQLYGNRLGSAFRRNLRVLCGFQPKKLL